MSCKCYLHLLIFGVYKVYFLVETGHTQYRGKRYCPNVPGQVPPEEWLAARKAEATVARASQQRGEDN